MQKVIAAIVIVALLLSGCSVAANTQTTTPATSTPEPEQFGAMLTSTTIAGRPQERAGNILDYHIEILGAKTYKDNNGDSFAVLDVQWTNNSKEAAPFSGPLMICAYQDNVECLECTDLSTASTTVKPGQTNKFQATYKLQDGATPLDVEITDSSETYVTDEMVYGQYDVK